MNIHAIQPQAASEGGSSSSPLPSSSSLNNMFLQLLVAQLQNQNPLDPMDPTQFVGQLAQFSELSEVTSIYQLLQQEAPASLGPASSPVTGSTPGAAINTGVSAAAQAVQPFPDVSSPTMKLFEPRIQGVF